ncbi:MAG: hypothetical protein JSS76_07700 [Bacteroidetes bacterium]|nr:hypothetical protein [Bacteroidota bacterium]
MARTFDIMRTRIRNFFRFDADDPLMWVIVAILLIALIILAADMAVWFLF